MHAAVAVILSSLQGITQHLVCVCVCAHGRSRERGASRKSGPRGGISRRPQVSYTSAAWQAQGTPGECRLASYAALASLNTDTHVHMHSWTHRLTS